MSFFTKEDDFIVRFAVGFLLFTAGLCLFAGFIGICIGAVKFVKWAWYL